MLTRPPATRGQRIAAEFLGIAPWRLSSPGRRGEMIETTEHEWGTLRESHWDQWRGLGVTDWFGVAAMVTVDQDREIVTSCSWEPLAEKIAWWPPRLRDLDEEECIQRAEAFMAERSSVYSDSDELLPHRPPRSSADPDLWLEWQGNGPGDLMHVINLAVSRRTGKPMLYSVKLGTPPPPELTEVKVTPEQAEEVVRAALPDNVFDAVVEAPEQPSWRSPFAPIGQPVYCVAVEGKLRPTRPSPVDSLAWCTTFGVHASTGELLREVVP